MATGDDDDNDDFFFFLGGIKRFFRHFFGLFFSVWEADGLLFKAMFV